MTEITQPFSDDFRLAVALGIRYIKGRSGKDLVFGKTSEIEPVFSPNSVTVYRGDAPPDALMETMSGFMSSNPEDLSLAPAIRLIQGEQATTFNAVWENAPGYTTMAISPMPNYAGEYGNLQRLVSLTGGAFQRFAPLAMMHLFFYNDVYRVVITRLGIDEQLINQALITIPEALKAVATTSPEQYRYARIMEGMERRGILDDVEMVIGALTTGAKFTGENNFLVGLT